MTDTDRIDFMERQTPEVTDLQKQLATLLGWRECDPMRRHVSQEGYPLIYCKGKEAAQLPSLPELVATAHGRLTNEQKEQFECIIASTEIRARAIIKVWK